MSMISELVEKLRVEAKSMGKYGTDYMATLLTRSADTIEMLSEKVRADRPQGEWVKVKNDGVWSYAEAYAECDQCHKVIFNGWKMNFCPNCGCRMKGADDEFHR